MSDEVVVDLGAPTVVDAVPEPESLYDDGALSIVVDDGTPKPDAEKEALKAALAAKEAEAQRLAGQPVDVLAKGLDALAKSVQRPAQAAPLPGQQPGETLEDFKKRINEKAFESPFDAYMEVLERYKGAEDSAQVARNLAYSKALAAQDAAAKPFIAKYADEIEAEIALLPPQVRQNDPKAYARAVQIVKANHIDDLVAEAVAAKAAPAAPQAAVAPRAAQYAESPSLANATPQKRQVTLSRSKYAQIEQHASNFGVEFSKAYEYFEAHGLL